MIEEVKPGIRKVWAVFDSKGKRYGGFKDYRQAAAFGRIGFSDMRVEQVEVDSKGYVTGEKKNA